MSLDVEHKVNMVQGQKDSPLTKYTTSNICWYCTESKLLNLMGAFTCICSTYCVRITSHGD